MKNRKVILLAASVVCCIVIVFFIAHFQIDKEQESIKVGMVLTGTHDEIGWNGSHYEGLKNACEQRGIELLLQENIKEYSGDIHQAVKQLVEDGATAIFLASTLYEEEMGDEINHYPETIFYAVAVEKSRENLSLYFARTYQAKYLAGILAGLQTKNGQVGYVAAMDNSEVNRGINAFALGVKRSNPDATVWVRYTGEWDAEEKERQAAQKLIKDKKIDVITYQQNQDYVLEEAEKAGIYSIGHMITPENTSEKVLTSVVVNWESVYDELLHQVQQGNGNAIPHYWIGLEKEAVDLAPFSPQVSAEAVAEVDKAKKEIISGKDVFEGPIYDKDGNLLCDSGEMISDTILLTGCDWFVEGIELYEE